MKDTDFLTHLEYNNSHTTCVSICKSNIKSKDNLYYARVCKTEHVSMDDLLSILKTKSFQVDVDLMKANLLKLKEIIIDLASEGKSVDLFGLGTFSLAATGKIEIKEGSRQYVDDNFHQDNEDDKRELGVASGNSDSKEYIEKRNADFDISNAIKTRPKFHLKFTPSSYCKKKIEEVKMAFAIKKRRSPLIKSIENITPRNLSSNMSLIQVKGDNLKVLGKKSEVGVYIEEENGKVIKIDKENIIQNTPKKLIIALKESLKTPDKLTFSIITQYVKMGSSCTSSLLRGVTEKFNWQYGKACTKVQKKAG